MQNISVSITHNEKLFTLMINVQTCTCLHHMDTSNYMLQLTQSKSKTTITRSVHGKFNCITVKNNGTQHSIYRNHIYIILALHYKFIIQTHFILSITKE